MEYTTKGTCSNKIVFEIEGDVLTSVKFVGGCRGNTQGVARLAEGRKVDDVIKLLDGVVCRNGTSCPDQLAKALKAYRTEHTQKADGAAQ
ncbi:MAG: TIGR03905 family TSCPD domain-containing protein [Clostridiales bacterium]|nr:TIGR03905 family TSCPD domain-containing protein [Clostridiales bacterium]